jgi:hypothetical protein
MRRLQPRSIFRRRLLLDNVSGWYQVSSQQQTSVTRLDEDTCEKAVLGGAVLGGGGGGSIELLAMNTRTDFSGLVNGSCGAEETMVGWTQSALLGIPLVDVVMHPGLYLSAVMGLADPWCEVDTPTSFSVVGCHPDGRRRFEWFARGAPRAVVPTLRQMTGESCGDLVLAFPDLLVVLGTKGPPLTARVPADPDLLVAGDRRKEVTAIDLS